jgi:hypothetical protein
MNYYRFEEFLRQVKANSPLLRALVYGAVVVYGMSTMDKMTTRWAEVQFATIQEQVGQDTSLGGCSTDMECELAEQAAYQAVVRERGTKTTASK